MSDQIIGRIDDMAARIDDLEHNINDLMVQAGQADPDRHALQEPKWGLVATIKRLLLHFFVQAF